MLLRPICDTLECYSIISTSNSLPLLILFTSLSFLMRIFGSFLIFPTFPLSTSSSSAKHVTRDVYVSPMSPNSTSKKSSLPAARTLIVASDGTTCYIFVRFLRHLQEFQFKLVFHNSQYSVLILFKYYVA